MTYATRELSVATGTPFECYEFFTPVGTFRYTTMPFEVTLNSQLFKPRAGLSRTAADVSPIIDSLQTMDFLVPVVDPMAKAYAGRNVPDYFTAVVYRAHWGDDLTTEFTIEWRGEATNYGYDGNAGCFIFSTQSILQAKVQGETNTVYVQLSCNHRVYDDRCKANPADHTHVTTVTKIDAVFINVAAQGYPNHELQLGRMVNQRTGEERTIYANENNLITITYPFLDIIVGDMVSLIKGCTNTMGVCLARFNNVLNYGGFRYVPRSNLFLDNGDKTVVTTSTYRNPVYSIPTVGNRRV